VNDHPARALAPDAGARIPASSCWPSPPEPHYDFRKRADLDRFAATLGPHSEGWLLALYLDGRFNLAALEKIVPGPLAAAARSQYRLIERGIGLGAVGFILIHHGDEQEPRPSPEDKKALRHLSRLSDDMNCLLFDAAIVSAGKVARIGLW
jgi:DNA repair protein RadC